jgi:ABC-type spermidine/putrescine transport system permease subunit I
MLWRYGSVANPSAVVQPDSLGDVVRSDQEMAGTGPSRKLLLGFIPVGVLFAFFFLVPLIVMILYSFWKMDGFRVVPTWTLENYQALLGLNAYTRVLLKTFGISLAVTALCLLAGYPFAYFLVRHVGKKWQMPLLVLVIIPFWTSYLLRVYSWLTILGDQGVLNRFLQWVGLTNHPIGLFLYDRPAVILVLVYLYFPFAALTLYSSIERFDWDQLRAAMDLGASPMTAIFRILVPQIRPGIVTAVIFVFIPVLGEYLTPQIVGGTGGVMIGNLIVNFFQEAQYTRGAAISLLVTAFIVFLLIVFRKSLSTKEAYGA